MTPPLHCINHPDVETYLRCNKCGNPICIKCAVQTAVGYRCRDCIKGSQDVLYTNFGFAHYLITAAVALPLALIAGWLVPSLGWYAIILGPVTGGGIANVSHWAVGHRRSRYTWLIVCGCIAAGTLPKLALSLLTLLAIPLTSTGLSSAANHVTNGLIGIFWSIIYLATAIGTAYAWLRE